MSTVDWSLAPEGATHWTPDERVCNQFIRFFDGEWYWLGEVWNKYGAGTDWMASQLAGVVSKPEEKQPPAWSGPEDGLPTVGSVCEYSVFNADSWFQCEIKYVLNGYPHDDLGEWVAVIYCPHLERDQVARPDRFKFRAIKTPEQLAAEERERSVNDLASEISRYFNTEQPSGISVNLAQYLLDQGFKREGK